VVEPVIAAESGPERPEHVDVQALVPNAAVERLDVSVAPGLPRWDEVQAGAFAGPVGHCGAGEFGAVVAAQHGRITAVDGEAVELGDDVVTGDVAIDQAAEAFTPVTRQANRSLTFRVLIRWCPAARRRSGLRSFPTRSP
jgi:predicted NUDIX family NTP pyrophosphohydrolase